LKHYTISIKKRLILSIQKPVEIQVETDHMIPFIEIFSHIGN
jgi:hypothetical protein